MDANLLIERLCGTRPEIITSALRSLFTVGDTTLAAQLSADLRGLAHTNRELWLVETQARRVRVVSGRIRYIRCRINELNDRRIEKLLNKFKKIVGGWQDKKVCVLGLSFKPNTDDMREAPSLKVIPTLLDSGAQVSAYDPKANQLAQKLIPGFKTSKSTQEALEGADITILLVEWREFVDLAPQEIKNLMRGDWFIDTRNQFRKDQVESVGLKYIGIGIK